MMNNSILKDMRKAIGLNEDSEDFDTELLMHINSAIGILSQNGVTINKIITDDTYMWSELIDVNKEEENEFFQMVPLYMKMKTKLLFDPPPPSTVDQYKNTEEELLWRLKAAYENYNLDTQRR